MKRLLQLRVLDFGFLQDRDVGVGVFPEGEEIFVGGGNRLSSLNMTFIEAHRLFAQIMPQCEGEEPNVIRRNILPQSIGELWRSEDEEEWSDALASYWRTASVRNNLEIEEAMEKLDREAIRRTDSEGWRAFLRLYFIWKFKNTYLQQRLADLESNEPDRLFRIKDLLFTSDPRNVRKVIERARYIRGLGPAGASGLLAVLFPKWFGTVDQFVVYSLLEIGTLPETPKLLRMNSVNLTNDEAVLLIDILRKKAAQLNELFHTDEWTPRKIDMILWTIRDGQRCGYNSGIDEAAQRLESIGGLLQGKTDYLFGVGKGHLPRRIQDIAEKHGARLINHTEPDGRRRHWFACENLGTPHDEQRAKAVLDEIKALEERETARLRPQSWQQPEYVLPESVRRAEERKSKEFRAKVEEVPQELQPLPNSLPLDTGGPPRRK
jgi:hypothetical protein